MARSTIPKRPSTSRGFLRTIESIYDGLNHHYHSRLPLKNYSTEGADYGDGEIVRLTVSDYVERIAGTQLDKFAELLVSLSGSGKGDVVKPS